MTPILDRFILKERLSFRPQTWQQLVAFRIAQKLGDSDSAVHYAGLADQYSEAQLLTAFHRTLKSGTQSSLGRHFHFELLNLNGNSGRDFNGISRLLAVRVERRTIAVAVLKGQQLEHTDSRQLSSDRDKALGSALAFIHWIAGQFSLESAAIESVGGDTDIQRAMLSRAIEHTFKELALPFWKIARKDLLNAFGHPPLHSRRELRDVITNFWPVLSSMRAREFIADAVAIGLYAELERLLTTNPTPSNERPA